LILLDVLLVGVYNQNTVANTAIFNLYTQKYLAMVSNVTLHSYFNHQYEIPYG